MRGASDPQCRLCGALLSLFLLLLPLTQGRFLIRTIPSLRDESLADVNIGVLLSMSEYSNTDLCGPKLDTTSLHLPQAIKYIVNKINNESQLLPKGIRLGYVIFDDCHKPRAGTIQTLRFITNPTCEESVANNQTCTSVKPANHSSLLANDSFWDCPVPALNITSSGVVVNYRVVGLACCKWNTVSTAVNHLMTPLHMPMVSYSSSSDLLVGDRFKYFVRVIPQDKYQIDNVIEVIRHFQWKYISVLHVNDERSLSALNSLHDAMEKNQFGDNFCFGAQETVSISPTRENALKIAKSLLSHPNAKVVLLLHPWNTSIFLEALHLLDPKASYIWLAIGIANFDHPLNKMTLGSLLFHYQHTPDRGFHQHLANLSRDDLTDPWSKEAMKRRCCTENGSACTADQNLNFLGGTVDYFTLYIFDVFYMYANASRRVMEKYSCQTLRGEALRRCVGGKRLLQELRSTRQHGYSGWLEIDKSGERRGMSYASQLVLDDNGEVMKKLLFQYDTVQSKLIPVGHPVWPNTSLLPGREHPMSECSAECPPGMEKRTMARRCCWICRGCRKNQFLNLSRRCEACPQFHWPKADNSSCDEIVAERIRLYGAIGVCLSLATNFLLLTSLGVLVVFIWFHNSVLLDSDFLTINFIMQLGIVSGFVFVQLFMLEPSHVICQIIYVLLSLSIVLIVASLLVRLISLQVVLKIIEVVGPQDEDQPGIAIKTSVQLAMVGFLVLVQMVICLICGLAEDNWYGKDQPNMDHPYVEQTCEFPFSALGATFAYNFVLLCLCCGLAFRLRHLSEHMLDNQYAGNCVAVMFIVFLCMLPAYVVAVIDVMRMYVIVVVIILNHTAAMGLLFVPLVYELATKEEARQMNSRETLVKLYKSKHTQPPRKPARDDGVQQPALDNSNPSPIQSDVQSAEAEVKSR